MKVALLLLLCVASVFALDFSYSGNVSTDVNVINTHGWNYRKVQLQVWDVLNSWSGASYLSYQVTKGKQSRTYDVIGGACYVNANTHPFAYLAYFEATADWSLPISSGQSFATLSNFTAADGYVGNFFYYLVETNTNGTIVARQNLKSVQVLTTPSATNGLTYTISDHSTGDANLKYITYTGSLGTSASSFSIELTFIASSIAGVLNVSQTVVGPKTIESVAHISNWPYQNAANTLSLIMGVGTGAAALSGSGQTLISQGAASQVFFSVSGTATVSGSNANVNIKVTANTTDVLQTLNANFYTQLTAKYGATASFKFVTATFPAGASDIIYDPSTGVGNPMTDTSAMSSDDSSLSTPSTTGSPAPHLTAFSAATVLLAALVAFFL